MAEPVNFDAKSHIDATKKAWLERQEIYRKMYYRKSKYPPMQIEPFPLERMRLPFQMTAEDRALRHQWLRDQHLTPREPRYVPELRPRNFFRRTFGLPWDWITKALLPYTGVRGGHYVRYFGPKFGMYFAGIFIIADYFAHNRSRWEMDRGWNVFYNRAPSYLCDTKDPVVADRDNHEKHGAEFFDRGFSKRKALLDYETSTMPQ